MMACTGLCSLRAGPWDPSSGPDLKPAPQPKFQDRQMGFFLGTGRGFPCAVPAVPRVAACQELFPRSRNVSPHHQRQAIKRCPWAVALKARAPGVRESSHPETGARKGGRGREERGEGGASAKAGRWRYGWRAG